MSQALAERRPELRSDAAAFKEAEYTYIYIYIYILVVSLNYCSQNGGNLYRAPYYNKALRPFRGTLGTLKGTDRVYGSFPKIGGPQYGPQNTIILIMGTLNKVPLILGNPPIYI